MHIFKPSSIARTDVRGSTSRRINSMSAPSERTHVDRKAATAAYSALDVELSSKAHAGARRGPTTSSTAPSAGASRPSSSAVWTAS
ncbi:hypothetical protein JL722_13910 [Aureococcus anophagefferens]|nr:hypothetical protein JL722_13910 [Aureococcus anophagefferens]